jgi:predicted porin
MVLRSNAADDTPVPTISIYGLAHVSADYTDNGSSGGTYLSSNSSRLGFKGGAKLNDDFAVIYQLESQVNLNGSGGVFASRNSYVGFNGEFGQLWGGIYDTPFKQACDLTDLVRDRIGDYKNIAGNAGKFDLRPNNMVLYQTPACAGLNATLGYAMADGTNYSDLGSANICYKTNNLKLMAAYEVHGKAITGTAASSAYEVSSAIDPLTGQNKVVTVTTPAKLSEDNESGIRFTASYTFNAIELIGLYEKLFDVGGLPNNDRETYGGAFILDMSRGYALRGECLSAGKTGDKDGTEAIEYAGAVDKKLSANTTIYISCATMDNGSASSLTATGGGHGSKVSPAAAGDSVQSESLGVIYTF